MSRRTIVCLLSDVFASTNHIRARGWPFLELDADTDLRPLSFVHAGGVARRKHGAEAVAEVEEVALGEADRRAAADHDHRPVLSAVEVAAELDEVAVRAQCRFVFHVSETHAKRD